MTEHTSNQHSQSKRSRLIELERQRLAALDEHTRLTLEKTALKTEERRILSEKLKASDGLTKAKADLDQAAKDFYQGQLDNLNVQMSVIEAKIKAKQAEIDKQQKVIDGIKLKIKILMEGDDFASLGNAQKPPNAFNAKMPWPGADSQSGPGAPAKPPAKPIDPLDRSPFDLPAVEREVNDLWRSRNDPAPNNQPDPPDTLPPAEPPKRRTLADMIGEMAELRRQDQQAGPLAAPDPVPPLDDFGADLDTDASDGSKPFSQPVFDEIIPLPRNPTFREAYYHKASKHQVEERQRRQRKLKPQ